MAISSLLGIFVVIPKTEGVNKQVDPENALGLILQFLHLT